VLVALTLWTASPALGGDPGDISDPATGLLSTARDIVFQFFAFGQWLLAKAGV
jgi:hypothetical protein